MDISDINIKLQTRKNILFCHFSHDLNVLGYMIHIMKPLDVSSMLKAKKNFKVQSPIFITFWTQIEQTSHCDL